MKREILVAAVLMLAVTSCGKSIEDSSEIVEIESEEEPLSVSSNDIYSGNDITEATSEENSSNSSDELLEEFLEDEISADGKAFGLDDFKISDLDINDEDVEAYQIGNRVDLDNDGENELIINNMYGGMYLDARDGGVYVFAMSEGTAKTLSYLKYDDATWVVYSDTLHGGRCYYELERFKGGEDIDETITLLKEWDVENGSEEDATYYVDDVEVEEEVYSQLYSSIFHE